jgi:hypothetical protein
VPTLERAWGGLPSTIARSGSVGRVELKVLLDVPPGDAVAALRLSGASVTSREVYYLDTPDLALREQGILIRARIPASGGPQLVVKLRTSAPRELPKSVARLSNLCVELDALPYETQWCASVKSRPRRLPLCSDWRTGHRRRQGWSDIFSADQRAFLARLAGDPRLAAEIRPFGPASVRKFRGRTAGLPCVAVESWTYPDGYRLVELSTKCAPRRAHYTARRLRRLLAAHQMPPRRAQLSKTEISLRRFG